MLTQIGVNGEPTLRPRASVRSSARRKATAKLHPTRPANVPAASQPQPRTTSPCLTLGEGSPRIGFTVSLPLFLDDLAHNV